MLFSKLVQDGIDAEGEHKVVLLLLDSLLARFLRAPTPLYFLDVEFLFLVGGFAMVEELQQLSEPCKGLRAPR